MKKTKKMLSVLMIAALAFGMFAGCQKKNASDGDVTTVTMWSNMSASFDVLKGFVDEWNETVGKEKNIKFDIQLKAGDTISQNIEVAIKTEKGPDLFAGAGGQVKAYAEKGYIAAIDELPNGQEIVKKYEDIIDTEYAVYNGKTYYVPYGTTLRGLIYNKDMFKAAGLVDENGEPTPPKTFDEYREYAKKLTNTQKGEYGVVLPMKWSGWFGSDISTLSQSNVGHAGYNPVTGEYDYDNYAQMMDYVLAIYNDKSMYPDTEGLDNDTARALFAEGKIGMKIAYSFDVGVLNNQFPAKCSWGVAPLPVLDSNNRYYQKMSYGVSPLINKSVLKDEKKAAAVKEVYDFWTSEEMQINLYKAGIQFPVRYETISNVELGDDAPKGWEDFAKMLEISHVSSNEPKTDSADLVSLQDRFIESVLTGKKKSKTVVDEYVSDLKKAKDIYYSNNPEEDPDKYIDVDWNLKLLNQ